MFPVLFKIGNFPIYSYGVVLVIAFFVGMLIARRRAPRYGVTPDQIWDVSVYGLIAGILGARIVFILLELPNYLKDPKLFLHWRFDGLTSYGGLIGGLLAFLIWSRVTKVQVLKVLDTVSAPVLVSHAIGRVGCLLNGCCFGGACTLPWAIHVPGELGLHHPAQIYDSIFNLIGFAVLLFIEKKKKLILGQSFALFLMLHGLTRVIYELWRIDASSARFYGMPFTEAQAASVGIILAGIIMYVALGKRTSQVSRRTA